MTVKWYGDRVLKQVRRAGDDILDEAAKVIIEHGRQNVITNDQRDADHMLNNFYTVSEKGSTFRSTNPPGTYYGRKSGGMVRRERAPEIPKPGPGRAIAANAAPYALFPEMRNSFMFRAALMAVDEVPNIVAVVRRRHGLD